MELVVPDVLLRDGEQLCRERFKMLFEDCGPGESCLWEIKQEFTGEDVVGEDEASARRNVSSGLMDLIVWGSTGVPWSCYTHRWNVSVRVGHDSCKGC